MVRLKTIVVDDEKKARDGLQMLLSRDPDIELVSVCKDGMEAIQEIEKHRPRLLFLDIQMPEINGFEVLNSINTREMPAVIFTTAYDEYALKAFEVHALDYLLKPFTDHRFYEALAHAKRHIGETDFRGGMNRKLLALLKDFAQDHAASGAGHVIDRWGQRASPLEDRLMIKSSGRILFLKKSEIIRIEAEDYYARIYMEKGECLVRESLKTLEVRLAEPGFVRIHRSTIVNIRFVRSLESFFSGDFHVILADGKRIKGSRNYRKRLESLF